MKKDDGNARQWPWLTPERLSAFTDGVLAIIITILVLGIEVPQDADATLQGVLSLLAKLEHDVLVYFLSFFLILTYWLQHYILFHYVKRVNRALVFWNGAFLFLLSLSPFTTGLAGAYRGIPLADAVFGVNYCLCGLAFFGMWRYCVRNPHLLDRPVAPEVQRNMDRRVLAAPLLSLAGIFVALIDFHLAALVFLSIPFVYARHSLIDTRWRVEDQENA